MNPTEIDELIAVNHNIESCQGTNYQLLLEELGVDELLPTLLDRLTHWDRLVRMGAITLLHVRRPRTRLVFDALRPLIHDEELYVRAWALQLLAVYQPYCRELIPEVLKIVEDEKDSEDQLARVAALRFMIIQDRDTYEEPFMREIDKHIVMGSWTSATMLGLLTFVENTMVDIGNDPFNEMEIPVSDAEPMVLYPYQLSGGLWCFDDPGTGLKEELFVRGADDCISRMVEARQIANANNGFKMTFGGEEFPGYDVVVEWTGCEGDGNTYTGMIAGEQMDLWLCPALGRYFRSTPQRIYVRVEPLPEGIDPVWHDGGRGYRYVGD